MTEIEKAPTFAMLFLNNENRNHFIEMPLADDRYFPLIVANDTVGNAFVFCDEVKSLNWPNFVDKPFITQSLFLTPHGVMQLSSEQLRILENALSAAVLFHYFAKLQRSSLNFNLGTNKVMVTDSFG